MTINIRVDVGGQGADVHTRHHHTAHAYCLARPRRQRCRAAACHWHYPPGTPFHAQTARMLHHTAWSLGLWAIVWLGLWIRHRYGKTGTWIYVGALLAVVFVGNVVSPAPPPDRPVVTVPPAPDAPTWSTR